MCVCVYVFLCAMKSISQICRTVNWVFQLVNFRTQHTHTNARFLFFVFCSCDRVEMAGGKDAEGFSSIYMTQRITNELRALRAPSLSLSLSFMHTLFLYGSLKIGYKRTFKTITIHSAWHMCIFATFYMAEPFKTHSTYLTRAVWKVLNVFQQQFFCHSSFSSTRLLHLYSFFYMYLCCVVSCSFHSDLNINV